MGQRLGQGMVLQFQELEEFQPDQIRLLEQVLTAKHQQLIAVKKPLVAIHLFEITAACLIAVFLQTEFTATGESFAFSIEGGFRFQWLKPQPSGVEDL